ncbi:hypothetical protein HJG60_008353 [Phyllostomus discolor]|uniref:Uncharacterized protein n=1 Tax=Phyllostomus discolor TaxID=89673 RepID=A0A833Z6Z0_9CHIR|nr:hypothetical protein HJG60_008353 [Phyllostomus discolor]
MTFYRGEAAGGVLGAVRRAGPPGTTPGASHGRAPGGGVRSCPGAASTIAGPGGGWGGPSSQGLSQRSPSAARGGVGGGTCAVSSTDPAAAAFAPRPPGAVSRTRADSSVALRPAARSPRWRGRVPTRMVCGRTETFTRSTKAGSKEITARTRKHHLFCGRVERRSRCGVSGAPRGGEGSHRRARLFHTARQVSRGWGDKAPGPGPNPSPPAQGAFAQI